MVLISTQKPYGFAAQHRRAAKRMLVDFRLQPQAGGTDIAHPWFPQAKDGAWQRGAFKASWWPAVAGKHSAVVPPQNQAQMRRSNAGAGRAGRNT